jgi:hypothetical protein
MANEDINVATPIIPAVASLLAYDTRAQVFFVDITHAKMDFATSAVLGESFVEIPPGPVLPP